MYDMTGGAHRGTPKIFCEAKILGDNARQDPSVVKYES